MILLALVMRLNKCPPPFVPLFTLLNKLDPSPHRANAIYECFCQTIHVYYQSGTIDQLIDFRAFFMKLQFQNLYSRLHSSFPFAGAFSISPVCSYMQQALFATYTAAVCSV